MAITNTGGFQRWSWFETPVTDPGGPFKMLLVFKATGTHYIANINFFEFLGKGIVTNREPIVESIALNTPEPRTDDTLEANVTTSDADGHTVDVAYRWLRNGTPIAGATGPTLDLSAAGHGDKGDTIAVQATPRDVYGPGAAKTSAAVTVLNSAPVIGSAQALPADLVEGDEVAFDGTATDADGDPLAISWAFGDGASSAGDLAATHRYADGPGSYTATLTVTDADAASDSADVGVAVANAKPVVTAPADVRVQAGNTVHLALGSFADPGADSPWSLTVDWGDGSPISTPPDRTAAGSLGNAGHEYRSVGDAQFTVQVTVTDKDGGAGRASFKVRVDGVETQVKTLAQEIEATASIPTATVRTPVHKLDQFLAGYDATDAEAKSEACDQLEPFKALLAAKTNKGITPAQAERWSADADRVGDLAGC